MSSNNGFVQIASSNGYVFTNSSNNDLVVYQTNSANQILIGAQSNAYANIAVNSSNVAFNVAGGTSNSTIKLNTNNGASNALTVSGTGNVGIANTNPQYTLDVTGNINFTGSLLYQGNLCGGKVPCFSAYSSSATNVGSNVNTVIGFQTKDYDTNGCYNNTGSTTTLNSLSVPAYSFCPNVPGYYMVIASGVSCSGASAGAYYSILLFKNGAQIAQGTQSSGVGLYICGVSALTYLNGTGDYVNIQGIQFGVATASAGTSISAATKFQANFIGYT